METAGQLRRGLLVLAALAVAATIGELLLLEHWGDVAQLVPWVALTIISACIVLLWWHPTRPAILATRVVAVASVAAAIWGIVAHLLANRAFAAEIHPDWSASSLLWGGITGNLPILAPCTVAFAGTLTAAATIGHPGRSPVPEAVTGGSALGEAVAP